MKENQSTDARDDDFGHNDLAALSFDSRNGIVYRIDGDRAFVAIGSLTGNQLPSPLKRTHRVGPLVVSSLDLIEAGRPPGLKLPSKNLAVELTRPLQIVGVDREMRNISHRFPLYQDLFAAFSCQQNNGLSSRCLAVYCQQISRMRHIEKKRFGPDGSVLVRTYGVTFLNGHKSGPHKHDWDQLTYAAQGVMTVHTGKGVWVVPPHRAVWVPSGVEHEEEMSGHVAARSLFFVSGLSKALPRDCSTVNVPPLLRELILHATDLAVLDCKIPTQSRLIDVILDQLELVKTVPMQLPIPRDIRARKIAALLKEDPSMPAPLSEIARQVGASKRTLERLFRSETGMPFNQWRQRLRIIHALKLLGGGESVTSAALEAGYTSTSAFIAMFRKILGTTPSRYFSAEFKDERD